MSEVKAGLSEAFSLYLSLSSLDDDNDVFRVTVPLRPLLEVFKKEFSRTTR